MVRRAYAGGAVPTTLSVGISNVDTAATLVGLTGYPSGSSKWYACFDRGLPTEEKVLVTQVSGFVVTMTRGADGTTAVPHGPGAKFEHVITAVDADEANAHVNAGGNTHGLGVGVNFVGDSATQSLTNKTIDGDLNTFLDIPTSSSPAIMAAIAAVATRAPIGVISPYAGSAAPSGWLICNGSAVSRTAYAALFAAIGITYGSGDGTTTFNIPNLQGRVPVGLDAGQTEFDTRGETGGAKTHTLSVAEMPSHNHGGVTGGDPVVANSFMRVTTNAGTSFAFNTMPGYLSGSYVDYGAVPFPQHYHSVASQGSGSAHNNLQPYVTLNYIILAV
jgi:microcystin-dependent protein